MEYKQTIYDKYYSAFVKRRKGSISLEYYKEKATVFDSSWMSFFPENKEVKILDIGCGSGALLFWLQRKGYRNSEGIDINLEQIQLAEKYCIHNVYHQDMFSFLQGKKETYNVIVLRDVLEHLEKKDVMLCLDTCKNALNRKGFLIIQVPNAAFPFFGYYRYSDFTHETCFTTDSLEQVLNSIGFQKVKIKTAEIKPKKIRSKIKRLLKKIILRICSLSMFLLSGIKNAYLEPFILCFAYKTAKKDI